MRPFNAYLFRLYARTFRLHFVERACIILASQ
ncbi:protein YoaL [Escherichia coli]